MIFASSFYTATTTPESLPETAMQVVAPAAEGLDYMQLILHASLPVQLVLHLLVLGSVISWFIIFKKSRVYARADSACEEFESRFWSGIELNNLYAAATERNRQITGMEAIFEGGFREFMRLREKKGVDGRIQLEGAQRAMRVSTAREIDELDRSLETLANIGSTAPYVGLVGTVIGIMISFHGLASMKEATIATVAPGISEALVATAMGLVAAIPAVWAYNRFSTRVERLAVRYESFAEEFSSILQRKLHLDD